MNNETPPLRTDRFRSTLLWLVVLGSPLLLTRYYWIAHPTLLGPDQALLIAIAQSFVDGKHLYSQILERDSGANWRHHASESDSIAGDICIQRRAAALRTLGMLDLDVAA